MRFRASGDFIQIDRGVGWQDYFLKAINLVAAVPGTVPGELAARRGEYDQWLRLLADMNVNTIRLYTLHYPRFYEAFGAYNQAHPDHPLYLLQGIWLDEIEEDMLGNFEGDYITDRTQALEKEIRYVIDALHGNAVIPESKERLGKATGVYSMDVSSFVVGWQVGSEMLGQIVVQTNEVWNELHQYEGRYLSCPNGLPIEAWVANMMDEVIDYELERWGQQRPVAWSNWPALDPIHHPTESSRFSQDAVDVDFGAFEVHEPFEAGLFVSYNVYPFNPEFIVYDPQYVSTIDSKGEHNSYLGYLRDLKAHHPNIPLTIGEFGVPSSFGVAHLNQNGGNHGGYDELTHAQKMVDLYDNIVEAGCAGAAVFESIDEWFKRTWMTNPTTQPSDRARLWLDVLNPEENNGVFSHYPIPSLSRTVDGDTSDWNAQDLYARQPAAPLFASTADDPSRTLLALYAAADPAFLFLRLDVGGDAVPSLDNTLYYIGISTTDGQTGDRRFPELSLTGDNGFGMESLLVIDSRAGRVWLLTDDQYDPSPRINGEAKTGGVPLPNDNGLFQLSRWLVMNDEQYLTEGIDLPAAKKQYFAPGRLRVGNSEIDTLAHFMVGDRGVVEVRIPWHALWVSDPSSRQIIWDDTQSFAPIKLSSRQTEGFRFLVVSATYDEQGILQMVDALPRKAVREQTVVGSQVPLFSWPTWDEPPKTVLRLKPVYGALQSAFGGTP